MKHFELRRKHVFVAVSYDCFYALRGYLAIGMPAPSASISVIPPNQYIHKVQYYTVISWLRGEQSNYCPEVVEKIWETVARGRRPRATVSQIFSTTEGQWFDCSPSSLEITVLLPNCFKSPKYCKQYADARRWRRDIWRVMTSFVTWPVNSELFTGK